jgi:hypothetical protein
MTARSHILESQNLGKKCDYKYECQSYFGLILYGRTIYAYWEWLSTS